MSFNDKNHYEIRFTVAGGSALEVPAPDELPMAGDILVMLTPYVTPGAGPMGPGSLDDDFFQFNVGDELHLMYRTQEAPYGKLSSLGNWMVIAGNGVTVWSNIEWLMATDTLEISHAGK
jgi:hypothetical protein